MPPSCSSSVPNFVPHASIFEIRRFRLLSRIRLAEIYPRANFCRIPTTFANGPSLCCGRGGLGVRVGAREGRRKGGQRRRLPRRFDGAALADHRAGQGRRGGAAIAALAAAAAAGEAEAPWRLLLGGFVGEKDKRRAKAKRYFSTQLDQLEGDENDAYLCNGGDSDAAETTVGKLAISCVDSTCDMCNMSGRGIRAPGFQSCNGTFLGEIMIGRPGPGRYLQNYPIPGAAATIHGHPTFGRSDSTHRSGQWSNIWRCGTIFAAGCDTFRHGDAGGRGDSSGNTPFQRSLRQSADSRRPGDAILRPGTASQRRPTAPAEPFPTVRRRPQRTSAARPLICCGRGAWASALGRARAVERAAREVVCRVGSTGGAAVAGIFLRKAPLSPSGRIWADLPGSWRKRPKKQGNVPRSTSQRPLLLKKSPAKSRPLVCNCVGSATFGATGRCIASAAPIPAIPRWRFNSSASRQK